MRGQNFLIAHAVFFCASFLSIGTFLRAPWDVRKHIHYILKRKHSSEQTKNLFYSCSILPAHLLNSACTLTHSVSLTLSISPKITCFFFIKWPKKCSKLTTVNLSKSYCMIHLTALIPQFFHFERKCLQILYICNKASRINSLSMHFHH